jgi:hypothetical protein
MIDIPQLKLPEVVDAQALREFKASIKPEAYSSPPEVTIFVNALSKKLGDFAQYGKEQQVISGDELLQVGITEWEGKKVFSFAKYYLYVPKLQAVDRAATMHRIYRKKGKQGLIDYCKFHTTGTSLERLLSVLEVSVFKNERPEFKKMLADIEKAPKIDSVL